MRPAPQEAMGANMAAMDVGETKQHEAATDETIARLRVMELGTTQHHAHWQGKLHPRKVILHSSATAES